MALLSCPTKGDHLEPYVLSKLARRSVLPLMALAAHPPSVMKGSMNAPPEGPIGMTMMLSGAAAAVRGLLAMVARMLAERNQL